MKKEKGSIILETSLVFPIVLLVMLAFSILVRYFVVYETIQHGMYETTREMSAYYYLYATSGVEKTADDLADTRQKASDNLGMLAEPFNLTIGNIRHISNELSSAKRELGKASTGDMKLADLDKLRGNVESIINETGEATTNIQDCAAAVKLIAESPLETMTYLLQYAVLGGMEWAQNSLMNLIGQALLSTHIPGGDLTRYTQAYGISDMNTAMAWNVGGRGDVEMVTSYKFTIRLFGGYDFLVTQRTTAKGWSLGV